jgi:hypothetical protein
LQILAKKGFQSHKLEVRVCLHKFPLCHGAVFNASGGKVLLLTWWVKAAEVASDLLRRSKSDTQVVARTTFSVISAVEGSWRVVTLTHGKQPQGIRQWKEFHLFETKNVLDCIEVK